MAVLLRTFFCNLLLQLLLRSVCSPPWPRWAPLYRYKLQPTKHLDVSVLPRLVTTLITVQLTVFLPVRCNSVRASNEGS